MAGARRVDGDRIVRRLRRRRQRRGRRAAQPDEEQAEDVLFGEEESGIGAELAAARADSPDGLLPVDVALDLFASIGGGGGFGAGGGAGTGDAGGGGSSFLPLGAELLGIDTNPSGSGVVVRHDGAADVCG